MTTTVFASPMTDREKLVREIVTELREAGVKVRQPGFPFALHHEYYRTKLGTHPHLRHMDVAALLLGWGESRERADDYVWQAVAGALLLIETKAKGTMGRLPQGIASRLAILENGSQFLDWAVGQSSTNAKAVASA